MPLAGLVLADAGMHGAVDGRAAGILVAGQSLIEFQIRSAHAAGASHIVIMVEHVSATLVSALDRLRGEGIAVEVARDARDASDRIHPDERLLVVGCDVVADRGTIAALIAAPTPSLLTLPFDQSDAGFERIDQHDRWAGMAIISGQMLRQTSALLGDWTLGPTLLRAALQAGAKRISLMDGSVIASVRDEKDAASVTQRLAERELITGESWLSRRVFNPIAKLIAIRALQAGIPFELMAVIAPAFSGMALLLVIAGWPGTAFCVLSLALIIADAAGSAAIGAMRSSSPIIWQSRSEPVMFLLVLGFGAVSFWTVAGWALGVLAAWLAWNIVFTRQRGYRQHQPGLTELALLLGVGFALAWPTIATGLAVTWQIAALWISTGAKSRAV